jgi:WD40 repeat protein
LLHECVRVLRCADASTLALVAEKMSAHGNPVIFGSVGVFSVGFSPDGTRVVSGSGDAFNGDQSVRVWGGRRSPVLCSLCARGSIGHAAVRRLEVMLWVRVLVCRCVDTGTTG